MMASWQTCRVAWGIALALATVLLGSVVPLASEAGWQPAILDSGEYGFGLMGVYGKGTVRETFRLGVIGMRRWRKMTPAELRADPLAGGP
jgi:hypothetical protein